MFRRIEANEKIKFPAKIKTFLIGECNGDVRYLIESLQLCYHTNFTLPKSADDLEYELVLKLLKLSTKSIRSAITFLRQDLILDQGFSIPDIISTIERVVLKTDLDFVSLKSRAQFLVSLTETKNRTSSSSLLQLSSCLSKLSL